MGRAINRMQYCALIYFLIINFIFGQEEVQMNNLIIKDGVYYGPLETKPYTGRIIEINNDGDIILETNCNRGIINGSWIAWYDNGEKKYEGYYKNGYRNGLWKAWHDSGQLWKEGFYFYDKKEGTWIYWYLNGNKQELKTYQNGKLNGPIKKWYSNGQQKMEGLYKEISEYGISSKYGKWVYYLNKSGTSRISKYYANN
jgi:antitoxin component YwqK of YwqJK toxin-antitoxin module